MEDSDPRVKIRPKEDGVILTFDGFDVEITVRPSVTEIPPRRVRVSDVQSALSDFLDSLSVMEEEDGSIVVKPITFLGRDRFASIAEIVRAFGGEYISAGKDSRFVIRVDKTQ